MLDVSNIKLRNYRGDLNFLKGRQNLQTLKLSNCFVEKDFTAISDLPDLQSVERFVMRSVGIIHITDIDQKMPMLEALDLQDNKIYDVQSVDELRLLSALADINLYGNPIMIHKNLQDDIVEVMPQLEVFNARDIQEAGTKFREDSRRIRKELEEWDKARPSGYTEADNVIADAIEDPTFELDMIMSKFKLEVHSDDEEEEKIAKIMKKNELITIKDKAN